MNTLTVNISEAKANLSKYANLVKKGQIVTLAQRNIPFAQIVPLTKTADALVEKRKHLIGDLLGKVKIIGDINEPLTKEELSDWYDGKLLP
ncbi:MAG: type II toxin-antitoxin system Phd/YefM family antitoxin [Candidatus Levyibacteriota bacterium]